MYIVVSYAVYLAVSIAVTIWVAATLRKNGRVFLVNLFRGDAALADSVNRVLIVGFYLINIGYVAGALRITSPPENLRQTIEMLIDRIGGVLLVLGWMPFLSLFVVGRMRLRGEERSLPPDIRASL